MFKWASCLVVCEHARLRVSCSGNSEDGGDGDDTTLLLAAILVVSIYS
jgi:hypothetical protein